MDTFAFFKGVAVGWGGKGVFRGLEWAWISKRKQHMQAGHSGGGRGWGWRHENEVVPTRQQPCVSPRKTKDSSRSRQGRSEILSVGSDDRGVPSGEGGGGWGGVDVST